MIQHDLSFHFDQPSFAFAGLEFAFQFFTSDNVYGMDPGQTSVTPMSKGVRIEARGLTWAGGQERSPGWLAAELARQGDVLRVKLNAGHTEPIKAAKVVIFGLPPGAVSELGDLVGPEGPDLSPLKVGSDHLVSLPGWMPGGLIFLHHGPRCTAFSSDDTEARPQRYYFTNRRGRFAAELIFEEEATRWSTHLDAPAWSITLDTTSSEAIARFAGWLEALDGLVPWEARTDVPAWARDLRLVVNLHGEHWTGYVFNTFDRMLEILQALDEWLPARHILAYVPGFSGRYYHSYPCYEPGVRLGGEAGFSRLVEGARSLGCRVMPMVGAHGCNVEHYARWAEAVVWDRYGHIVQQLNTPDWDADRSGEGNQIFLNLGEPRYREHLQSAVAGLVDHFGLEAVFFDTMSWLPNDARHSMWQGCQELLQALRTLYPQVLWASEGAHSRLLRYFPLIQMQLHQGARLLYPDFTSRYVRTFDHLDTGAPGLGSSGVHERGFHGFHEPEARRGHLPALSVVDGTLQEHRDTVQRVCQRAAGQDGLS